MKTMTTISIVLMFPTLVASIFGMNLFTGIENVWWGFPLVTVLSIVIAIASFWTFKYKHWI